MNNSLPSNPMDNRPTANRFPLTNSIAGQYDMPQIITDVTNLDGLDLSYLPEYPIQVQVPYQGIFIPEATEVPEQSRPQTSPPQSSPQTPISPSNRKGKGKGKGNGKEKENTRSPRGAEHANNVSRPPGTFPSPTMSDADRRRQKELSANSSPEAIGDDIVLPHFDPESDFRAILGFTTPSDFRTIITKYLSELSPNKRAKALLAQKCYDDIMYCLKNPKATDVRTAQFRHWARKMFSLTDFNGSIVICHDNRPVAVMEQIYEVLVHCHAQCNHGGRDKTSAQVRLYYSWIPKEIIAQFVKYCPVCSVKRTPTVGSLNMSDSQAFLYNLQSDDQQAEGGGQRISLAEARARAQEAGHRPYRKPNARVERPASTNVHIVGDSRSRGSFSAHQDHVHQQGLQLHSMPMLHTRSEPNSAQGAPQVAHAQPTPQMQLHVQEQHQERYQPQQNESWPDNMPAGWGFQNYDPLVQLQTAGAGPSNYRGVPQSLASEQQYAENQSYPHQVVNALELAPYGPTRSNERYTDAGEYPTYGYNAQHYGPTNEGQNASFMQPACQGESDFLSVLSGGSNPSAMVAQGNVVIDPALWGEREEDFGSYDGQ